MQPLFRRHPRYALFTGLLLVVTFLLLTKLGDRVILLPGSYEAYDRSEGGLSAFVDRAEGNYQRGVHDRKSLIEKLGPTPDKIEMFPANVSPYPAYTVWSFFPAAFNCPHEVERIGALGDGGKWVCGLHRLRNKRNCVVYSFGINGESSFEAELLSNTAHCEVWGYDFSVTKFGPEISFALWRRSHFKPFGLAGRDAHGSADQPKMYTLRSLMALNSHSHIDILKIDIEAWEFETLTALIKPYLDSGEPLPFGQLQLEIHAWNKDFSEYLQWWEMLEAAGLRPFWTEPNMVYTNYNRGGSSDLAEYSFLNIRGSNVFVSD